MTSDVSRRDSAAIIGRSNNQQQQVLRAEGPPSFRVIALPLIRACSQQSLLWRQQAITPIERIELTKGDHLVSESPPLTTENESFYSRKAW